jgi:uncharacterized protein (TIRG00374 family)
MVYSGRLDLEVVKKGFSHAPLLFASFVLVITAMASSLYRWSLLLKGQGIEINAFQLIRYGMIGSFFNTTMPGAVSGDIIKAWYVIADRKGQKKTPVLTAILLDRVFGVFGLVLVSASPLLWQWNLAWSNPELKRVTFSVLLLTAGMFVFFAYVMLSVWGPLAWVRKKMDGLQGKRVGEVLLQAYDALLSYRENPMILLQALVLSVLTHLLIVTVVIFCAQALGEDKLQFFHFFLLVPIGLLTTAIPVAPAGLGVGHVAFAALFGLVGSTHGAEVFTMLVTIQIALNLTGVFFYLRSPKIQPQDSQ